MQWLEFCVGRGTVCTVLRSHCVTRRAANDRPNDITERAAVRRTLDSITISFSFGQPLCVSFCSAFDWSDLRNAEHAAIDRSHDCSANRSSFGQSLLASLCSAINGPDHRNAERTAIDHSDFYAAQRFSFGQPLCLAVDEPDYLVAQ